MMKPITYASEPWFPSNEKSFTLFVEITKKCNQKCKHCFAFNENESKTTSLDDEHWFKLFDQLAELEKPRLFFTGGEPLEHPSIIKLISYASKKSIPIILGTNATLITPQIAKELHISGINEARVSIDGASAKTHDPLRGDGSFENTIKGISLLLKEGISVSIRTTVTKLNYQELDKVIDLVVGLGIYDWEVKHIIPAGRALHYPELLTTSKERIIALETIINTIKSNIYPQLRIKLMEGTLNRDALIPDTIKIASCPAGYRMMVVQPSGDVIPCGYLTSLVMGNVLEKSLKELREIWKKTDSFTLPVYCEDCQHRDRCKGGCPAFNFCKNAK